MHFKNSIHKKQVVPANALLCLKTLLVLLFTPFNKQTHITSFPLSWFVAHETLPHQSARECSCATSHGKAEVKGAVESTLAKSKDKM